MVSLCAYSAVSLAVRSFASHRLTLAFQVNEYVTSFAKSGISLLGKKEKRQRFGRVGTPLDAGGKLPVEHLQAQSRALNLVYARLTQADFLRARGLSFRSGHQMSP